MKKLLLGLILLSIPFSRTSAACEPVDLIVVGDSQTGATWAKSYLGNFLAEYLEGSFVMYGRGGTVPGQWLSQSNMDHIETIQRTPENHHQNIGSKDLVPDCKKRIGAMLDAHTPKRIVFQFGGNMIYLTDAQVTKQIHDLMNEVVIRNFEPAQCFFIMPTFEMAVATQRNVPARNLAAVLRVNRLIKVAINESCQVIDGVELMKNSPYFDGKELLKRVQIDGLVGCAGAAANDNVHVCGEAARDWAKRISEKLRL